MSKMQNVSFRTVEEVLDYIPDDQLEIVERLRELVFECIPEVHEKLAYNVPFYSRFKRICFIWPGAIPWGKKTREGVEFGFTSGYLLTDEEGYLDKGKRKQVFTKTFYSLREIDPDVLRVFLFEAANLDRQGG